MRGIRIRLCRLIVFPFLVAANCFRQIPEKAVKLFSTRQAALRLKARLLLRSRYYGADELLGARDPFARDELRRLRCRCPLETLLEL